MLVRHFKELGEASWLRQAHEIEGKTLQEIAAAIGCSGSSVSLAMRRAGIKVQNMRKGYGSHAPRPKKNRDTLHNEAWLRDRYLIEKLSTPEIARMCDCAVPSVCHALRKFNIPVREMSDAKTGRKIGSAQSEIGSGSVSRNRLQQYQRRQELKAEMVAAYGGCCACCGETEIAFLSLDHTNGGGAADRETHGGRDPLVKSLKRRGWPKEGYRILCMNCNIATKFGRTCPHQLKKEMQDVG